MSTTTQNRLSKQSQPKQKAGEPAKPRLLQPTTEQLRMAELLQKSNMPLTEEEIAEKVATLCDAAQCSEDDALIALGDADYDPNRALNLLIERPDGPDEWQQATAKKNKKTTAPQSNGERDAYVPEREARGVADGAAKRGRGGRGRTHATQNGEAENGRGRGRRQPRQNEHAPPAARDEETQQSQQVRATLNGHVHEQTDTQQTDEHGWQSARSRNDSRSKRGRTDGELDDGTRRGEARSVNRLAGRAPPAAQRGAASTRGRSAGPHQGDASRTYYTRRTHEQNGDAEVNDSAQPDDTAAGPRPDARASRGRAQNAGSRAPRNKQSNAPAANHAPPTSANTQDEWVNDEWEGGPGSWQNTDTTGQPKSEAPETNVISFASIVAQRNVNANASVNAATHSASAANSSAAPTATVNANANTNANAKPPQPASAPASASAQLAQPPVSASAATSAVAPSGTQVNAVAPQQTQPEDSTSHSQRPAPVANNQQAHTQKIDLADLLSKAASPQSQPQPQPHPQPQPATAPAAAPAPVPASAPASTVTTVAQPTTSVAPRPANPPFGGVSALGAPTAPLVPLAQPAYSQAALSNLAVGSQTQTNVGRSLAAPVSNQPRLLQDEAVVMPFKVSDSLSSAFQFGFNADYVNPNANTTPLDAALNRAPQQPQSVGFVQPTAAAVAVAQQQHAASFADSLAKQQHVNAVAPQVAPSSRTFGNVAQPPFPGVTQPTAASTVQTSTSSVSAVATGLNRMALDSDVAPGSAMKATANAFVPAHLGSVPQQQQTHIESSATHGSSQQQQRGDTSQLSSSAQQFFPYAHQQQSHSYSSANAQHQVATNNHQTNTSVSQSQANAAEPAVSISASQPQPPIGSNTIVSSNMQSKPTHIDNVRQLGGVGVGLGVTSAEDVATYAQPTRGQLPSAGPANTQAALQQMFNQLAANLFTQNVSPAQAQAAGQTGPSAPGPHSAAGTGGFNAPPGAPGQTQQYTPYTAVYQPYHTPFNAQAQQIFSLLQHGAPQNAAVQQPFAAASQPQSAAASGTPTQSNAAPPFGAATQFGIGLHSTMVGGAGATQSGAGAAQNSAQQNAATAKLLAAAASGGSFASQSYAGGDDSVNAFGSSSMFVNTDYQRQPGVVPSYQPKGGTTDYPPFKPQTHVGVVGAPMLDKSGASAYYNATGANQLPPSSNPPPGLGSVAGGQSTVSALNAANFGMYPNAAHHQYMMAAHPGMFVPNNIVPAPGAIGAPKAATPTKPPGFQTQGNWQQPY